MKIPKALKRIYGGQGGSRGPSVTTPSLEGGKDTDENFDKKYGNSGGAIETLSHGTPKGGGLLLPIEEGSLQDSRFGRGYGGPAGPIETLKFGSMAPREKKVRYPHNAKQAAGALRQRGGY